MLDREAEFAKLIADDVAAARRDYELFKDFFETPQWKRIMEILDAQVKRYEQSVVYDDEPHHIRNINRGICKGMLLVAHMPRLLLNDAELTIKQSEETPNEDE